MPSLVPAVKQEEPLDLRGLWLKEVDQAAVKHRWGLSLMAIGALHFTFFLACQAAVLTVGPTVRWVYPVLWISEVIATLFLMRMVAGRDWIRACPMVSVVSRVWVTYLILCFGLATLNNLGGWEHDWFKPVWCTLGTFGFATMAWLFSLWFLVPAFQMYFTAILMVEFPRWNFLIHGISFGMALAGIGLYLELRRRRIEQIPVSQAAASAAGFRKVSAPQACRSA